MTDEAGIMWAVVPFKDLTLAKQRLAGVLSSSERAELSQAMLQDLLTAMLDVDFLEGILIVSQEQMAESVARKFGVQIVAEDKSFGAGLNGAISGAINTLKSKSIDDIMIIHSDLPLVTAADLLTLSRTHSYHETRPALTIVPDRHQKGTNCLISSPSETIPLCFGENSLMNFMKAAKQHEIPITTLNLPGIMFDIDTSADLLSMFTQLAGTDENYAKNTRAFLHSADMENRIRSPFNEANHV